MPYGTFTTYEEVATKFKIKLAEHSFVQRLDIPVDRALLEFVGDNLKTRRSYVSENAICESIISPILNIVAKNNEIPVWSHVRFDVSEEEGLVGIPDFIIAPAAEIGTVFRNPVICIAEARRKKILTKAGRRLWPR